QLLDGGVDDLNAVAPRPPLTVQAAVQYVDEVCADLDGVEPVPGEHMPDDLRRHGAGPRPHFENAGRPARLAHLRDQGAGEEAAARQDRTRAPKMPSRLPQKLAALVQEPHPRAPPLKPTRKIRQEVGSKYTYRFFLRWPATSLAEPQIGRSGSSGRFP